MILSERFPTEIFEIPLAGEGQWLSAETWRSLRRLGVERIRLPRDPDLRGRCKALLDRVAELVDSRLSPTLIDHRVCELAFGCTWERGRWRLFDPYVREIHFVPRLSNGWPVQLEDDLLILAVEEEETATVLEEVPSTVGSGGMCINVVSVDATDPALVLQPIPLRFNESAQQTLRQDERLQRHIAHAYWQTVWAEGPVRVKQGETEPVAFLPLCRGPDRPYEPTEVLGVKPERLLVGRETIHRYELRQASESGELIYHPGKRCFEIKREGVRGESAVRRQEALEELNRAGFVDRWVGSNGELDRAGRPVVIRRLVPVAGCDVLSQLAPEIGRSPYVPSSAVQGELLAATNSVFFLNFPEEYQSLHAAMNDLVGLLIVDGEMWQPPILSRATLLIDEKGRATVAVVSMADCCLDLGGSIGRIDRFALNPDGPPAEQPAVYTPFYAASLPPAHNRTPDSEATELVVVDQRVVEIHTGGGTQIPMNGFVLSMPEVTTEWMVRHLWDYGPSVGIELELDHLGLSKIHTAIAAGPQLVRDGQPLMRNYLAAGPEEFLPLRIGRQGILQSGVPPTRFPHSVARVRAPRTAVGITENQQLLLVTVDGRNLENSIGMTLLELARFLCDLGCREALNLDGGGSTVMMISPDRCDVSPLFDGAPEGIANRPSDVGGRDRLIPAPLTVLERSNEMAMLFS